jgi:hypothetical protein
MAKMRNFEVIYEKCNLDSTYVITYLQEYKTTAITTTTTSTTATTTTPTPTTTTATTSVGPGNRCGRKSGFTSSQMFLLIFWSCREIR